MLYCNMANFNKICDFLFTLLKVFFANFKELNYIYYKLIDRISPSIGKIGTPQ